MGATKRLIEKQEAQRAAAAQIAIDAGVLTRCEWHGCLFEKDPDEIEAAYKLGNLRFSAGSLGEVFEDRREMTDAIQDVVRDSAWECPLCAKIRSE